MSAAGKVARCHTCKLELNRPAGQSNNDQIDAEVVVHQWCLQSLSACHSPAGDSSALAPSNMTPGRSFEFEFELKLELKLKRVLVGRLSTDRPVRQVVGRRMDRGYRSTRVFGLIRSHSSLQKSRNSERIGQTSLGGSLVVCAPFEASDTLRAPLARGSARFAHKCSTESAHTLSDVGVCLCVCAFVRNSAVLP